MRRSGFLLASTAICVLTAPAMAQSANQPANQPGSTSAQVDPIDAEAAQAQAASPAAPPRQAAPEPAAVTAPQGEQATVAPQDSNTTDIVVTAQRRTERLQDVPIAVAVASADQLSRQRVSQVSELSRSLAGVQFAPPAGGSGGGAYIRGLGTFARSRAAEPAVGIVIDGVVQGLVTTNQLADIARVEILRGPQGTLFGQSVSGGVVNITTNAPSTKKVEGFFEAEASGDNVAGSRFGRQLFRGSVNVPVNDWSAFRVNYYATRTNGIVYNTATGNSDEQLETGFRARYKADIGKFTMNLIADYGYEKFTNGGFQQYYYIKPTATRTIALLAQCGIVASPDNFEQCGDAPQRSLLRTFGLSAQGDVELGSLTLTSITSSRTKSTQGGTDIDRLPEALGTRQQQSGSAANYRQFTQELRLASDATRMLSATIGAFYLNSTVNGIQSPDQGAFGSSYNARAGLPGQAVVRNALSQIGRDKAENIAGFGEARLTLGQFVVFGGLRYTDLTLNHFDSRQQLSPTVTPIQVANLRYHDSDVSWRAGGQFKPTRDLMIFASAARGYKGALISPIAPPLSATIVRPEKPMNYEVGVKSTLFGNRLSINANGFYTRVQDYQASNCIPDAVTGVPTCNSVNIPRVISKGFEGEVFGRPIDGLTVNGSFAYTIAKYPDNFVAADGISLAGQQLAYAPRFRAVGAVAYTFPIAGQLEGILSFDANYKSRTRLGSNSGSQIEFFGRRTIFNASAGVQVDRSWRLVAFVDNIGNQRDPQTVGVLLSQLRDPANAVFGAIQTGASLRRVGLQGRYSF